MKTLLPQSSPADARPAPVPHDIVITVRSDHTVRLNQEPVEVTDLAERLLRLFQNGAGAVVFVRGDRRLEFRHIAEVIDIARGVGLDRITLMTE